MWFAYYINFPLVKIVFFLFIKQLLLLSSEACNDANSCNNLHSKCKSYFRTMVVNFISLEQLINRVNNILGQQ